MAAEKISGMCLQKRMRMAFAAWYGNGHVNESDPNTCLLKVKLNDGVLMNNGERYDIHFAKEEA